jgi:hypothetical protein
VRAEFRERPPWLVRVDGGGRVQGAGLLLDQDLVLTCAHVVAAALGTDFRFAECPPGAVAVTLPHARVSATGRVESWTPVAADGGGDVAVIRLDTGVDATPAPLSIPRMLAGHRYVIQGFPDERSYPAEATGRLGGGVGPQWVQMDEPDPSGFAVDHGFSGAPVWDETAEAVVGMVVARENDPSLRVGQMIPFAEVARLWPDLREWVGFRLDLDDAFDNHWLPRAQGLDPYESYALMDAWHFVGRKRVLSELADWLNQPPPDRKIRVVTGSPGSGKSAVLARTVVMADRMTRRRVPSGAVPADVPLPRLGSIDVAVHARGRTLKDVVRQLATAAGVDADDPVALVQQLHQRGGPFTVVVDALDEAASEDAIRIATLLGRIAADPARHGFRVLVGTRLGARGAAANALLERLGNKVAIDLDSTEPDRRTGLGYLELADLESYVERRLAGTGQAGLARAIAARADGNFLIAQVASAAALAAAESGDTSWGTKLPTTLGAALDDYLDARFGDHAETVRDLLTPLAFAEHPGFSEGPLWLATAEALTSTPRTRADLARVIASAGSYLVEQTTVDPPAYRLFHQALDDTLQIQYAERFPGRTGHRLVYDALLGQAPRASDGTINWDRADDYLRLNVPVHAAASGRLDDLVLDVGYLVVVPPERLLPHLGHVVSEPARAAAFVYQRTSHQFTGQDYPDRAAAFALVARQSGFPALADEAESRFATPWSGRPLAWDPESTEQTIARFSDGFAAALWLDPTGNPAALSGVDGGAGLYRTRGYRLELDDQVPLNEAAQIFGGHAVRVLDDGSEIGISLSNDGVLRKWSYTGGLRLLGELPLPGTSHSRLHAGPLGLAADTDGRLLAVAMGADAVYLVDAGGDTPRLLDQVGVEHGELITGGSATIGVQHGQVYVAWFESEEDLRGADEDAVWVRLARVAEGQLVECGPAMTAHKFNPSVLKFLNRPDGTLLLVSTSGTGVLLSTVTAGGLSAGSVILTDQVTAVDGIVLPDGRSIAAFGNLFGELSLWEVGEALTPLGSGRRGHELSVGNVALGVNGSGEPVLLSMGEIDTAVKLWAVGYVPPDPVDPPPPFGGTATAVALFPAGEDDMLAAVASDDGAAPELFIVTDHALLVPAWQSEQREDGLFYSGLSEAAALSYSGETDVLMGALGYDGVKVWRVTSEGLVELGESPLDPEGRNQVMALTQNDAGEPLIAVGDGDGGVSCYFIGGSGVERFAYQQPPDSTDRYDQEIGQLEFFGAADGMIRLLGLRGTIAIVWSLPEEGELPVLDTLDGLSRFATTWDGAATVVLAYRRSRDNEESCLYRLGQDRFEQIATPWRTELGAGPELDVSVQPDGGILCAFGDMAGQVLIGRHRPGGHAALVASAQVGSSVVRLRWTMSGTLVVWCGYGVIRITGDW